LLSPKTDVIEAEVRSNGSLTPYHQGLWEQIDCKKRADREPKLVALWSKKNWTSRASYWSCGNKTKGQENPTSDEDFWRVQVHNGPVEGREKEAWQWSGRATRRTCFRPRELTEDAKNKRWWIQMI
jgi:hypothetical protein